MQLSKLKQNYQITIPIDFCRAIGLEIDDEVELNLKDSEIIIKPTQMTDEEIMAFWKERAGAMETVELSEGGKRKLEEAFDDIEAGSVKVFDTVEELIEELNE